MASGISAWLLGYNLTGSARQLVIYQFVLKTAGVCAMLMLLLVEYVSGLPLLMALFEKLDMPAATTLAVVYVMMLVMCDLAVHPFHHQLAHFLDYCSPESIEEVLGKTRFLNDRALAEPISALELLECEQRSLLADLPNFVESLRDDGQQPSYPIAVRRSAGEKVITECEHFLTALVDRNQSRKVLDRVMVLRDRNDLIDALQETLVDLNHAVTSAAHVPEVSNLMHSLVEGLHMMLIVLAEMQAPPDTEDLDMLRSLTHDRSDLMDTIRQRLLGLGEALTPGLQRSVFSAISLFERSVWLLRRYVVLLDMDRFKAETVSARLME
jgi:phosphate:Na+ symporter